ncbi:MAG TPA: NPCBM/NEW2 domain-containing protein [Candidatus Sulfotelmatobacter sp.]|nr:NPCBM/NEW2 domain-containing protein [Candidatus Sulfotelmatobacter sp.]
MYKALGTEASSLTVSSDEVRLSVAQTTYLFTRRNSTWALDSVWVNGKKTVLPLSRQDSFWLGSGESRTFQVVDRSSRRREIRFSNFTQAEHDHSISFSVFDDYVLPRLSIECFGSKSATCAFRTVQSDRNQRGAWATRGETASDGEGREVFIDGSGRLVFGHSCAGDLDVAYVIQFDLLDNIDPRGRSTQPTDTFFKSGRIENGDGQHFGCWQVRLGENQPKRFKIIFDRDLGGRLHNVCEKYYAHAVDSQVDLASIPDHYDPYTALDRMPLRLACPESLIAGFGWHMEEYSVHGARSAYPYGHDSGIQTAALLAYEGLATAREWEHNFGDYVASQMPLWGESDGTGYFVRRPGGWTRWTYVSDYQHKFPFAEGGNWGASEHLYRIAVLSGDDELKARSLDLMKHDVLVKLDLGNMYFPPRWNPLTSKQQDHGDDWAITACLGYCAEISSEILYLETKDPQYLRIADRITDWLHAIWAPELRMNYLHPRVNTFHCWMGWLPNALVHRYERSGNASFLEIAKDLVWIMILTSCTTAHHDSTGRPLTGVTCVGARDCVDYDCTPNLCQEKDQPFLQMMGLILNHASGPGYAKYLAMQKLVLPRDRWEEAFGIQEQREVNLRTNYDNYPRAMTNLAFALNRGSDPHVAIFEKLVSTFDSRIPTMRDIVFANGTATDRQTSVQVRFLRPGVYSVSLDGGDPGTRTSEELAQGVIVTVPANSMRTLRVSPVSLRPSVASATTYDSSVTYLSDLQEYAAQRGVGLPTPVFAKDRSFHGGALSLNGTVYPKGLGLAANTVILYDLNRQHQSFAALVGIAEDIPADGPRPSLNLTIFCDGKCQFDSGGIYPDTPARPVAVDVRSIQMLVIRVSSDWDNDGDLRNDFGNLAGARLIGQALRNKDE